MRVRGSYSPPSHEIEVDGNNVVLRFYENVEEINEVDEANGTAFVGYEFDRYTIKRSYDKALAGRVNTNVAAWREMAKREEMDALAAKIRAERAARICATDWAALPDAPLTSDKREAYRVYRQALRDIPQRPGFPYENVEFPVEPS